MINTDYGWIDDESHKIIPKANKETVKDLLIGLVPIIGGIGYIAFNMFHRGARAYETAEYDVLDELGKITPTPKIDISEEVKEMKW